MIDIDTTIREEIALDLSVMGLPNTAEIMARYQTVADRYCESLIECILGE